MTRMAYGCRVRRHVRVPSAIRIRHPHPQRRVATSKRRRTLIASGPRLRRSTWPSYASSYSSLIILIEVRSCAYSGTGHAQQTRVNRLTFSVVLATGRDHHWYCCHSSMRVRFVWVVWVVWVVCVQTLRVRVRGVHVWVSRSSATRHDKLVSGKE
jgi:hypothetical protein